jgi:hypothetical protein
MLVMRRSAPCTMPAYSHATPNELHLLLYRTLSRRALELSNMFFAQALLS